MAGGAVKEKVITVGPSDSLSNKTSRTEYEGYEVDEINPGGSFIRFANNIEMSIGDEIGADKEEIFAAQIRYTIEEHFRKQSRLASADIKVLSLFFIDQVDSYAEDDGLIRRLFNEALDAGGCGWSAQRLPPTGPAAVQRDYDGTPMPTDVMHDDTCRELAKVLGRRNEGFMQMLLITGENRRDQQFYEEMAEISGRPMIMNVVQAFDHRPELHRRVLKWLKSCRERGIRVIGQGLTTDAGFTFTFEEWNLFDDSEPWCEATTGSLAERKQKLGDPVRRQALKDNLPFTATGPLPGIVIVGPQLEKNQPWLDHTLALAGEKMGKHPVDVMLDMAVEEDLKTQFFAAPPNGSIEYLKEIVDDPYVLFGVSDGGAHTKFLTAGRYPTETLCKIVREHQMISLEDVHWRLSALPAQVAGFTGRGVLCKGAPADIVVYDFDNLRVLPDEIVHDLPGGEWRRIQRASGYRYVLVNGEVIIRDDQQTGVHSGLLLRHGGGLRASQAAAAG
ncbi:MAG: amidohydrolase family protein [SAR324 cluster bacterium]|nr:amidohydrolase family protein [SAR324 cluster bacterium]